MTNRRKFYPGLLLVVALAMASACSSDSTDTSTEAPAAASGATATTVPSIDPAASLVYASNAAVDTLDPHGLPAGGTQLDSLLPVYDRLIQTDDKGTFVPGLALSWSTAADGMSVELKLRDKVVFHDGTPFNADSVKVNLERAASASSSTFVKGQVSSVDRVEVVDPLTVVIRLKKADFSFVFKLTENVGMMVSPTAIAANVKLSSQPVGAGPYKITEFVPGQTTKYERFTGYWDPKAAGAAKLEIRTVTDSAARMNGTVSGQFSLAIGEAALADQGKSSGLTIVRQDKGVAVNVLWLNRARNNLGNPLVRQALSHAIDRDALIKLAFGAGTSTLQILPDGLNDPTQTAKGWFDPVLAKKLLTDAGFPNGFKLGMLTYTRPELQQQATAIQAMFKQIGIDTEIRAVDPTQFGVFLNGEIDTWYATSSGRTDPLEALTSMYGSAGNTNPAKTTSAGLDAMIAKAGATAPGPDRDKLVQQISGLAAQDVLTIPTYFPSRFWFAAKCVVGFVPNVSGAQSLRGVGIASNCK